MATYRGRKTDICRTVGFNIWGKPKCPSAKRPYPLGQHGPNLRERRQSEYGEQLLQDPDFEGILKEEEDHIDTLEAQLDQIRQMGVAGYLTEQLD